MNTPRNFTSFIIDPLNFPMDAPSSIILLGVQLITPIGLLNRTPRGIRGIIPQGVWFRIKLGYSRKNYSRGYTAKWADFGLLGDLRHVCINFINLLIKKNYLKDFYSDCSSLLWRDLHDFVKVKKILRWTPFQKCLFILFWNTCFDCTKKYYLIFKTCDLLLKSVHPWWSPMPYCY